MAVSHYRQLIAWQKSVDFVSAVYACSAVFPRSETYGLTNQMRRCAVSIPSNIAEGQGRGSTKEFVHFLHVAFGSMQECEIQRIIASRLGNIDAEALEVLLSTSAEVGRVFNGLICSLLATDN